jgi:hypothetical protein
VAPGGSSTGFHAKIRKYIKPECVRILNILACIILTAGAVIRIIQCFKAFNLFFFITSLYFFVFIAFVASIEISQVNKLSIFIRTHFNFLDQMFGRGLFLIFLSFMLIERQTNMEVLMAVLVIIIASLDLILGFGDAKRALASLPWESVSAGGAAGGGDQ